MKFRILGDYFNRILTDDKGQKVFIGEEGLPHIRKFPFKERIVEGAPIIICDGELQAEANLEFDQESRSWYARIDWSTRRDLISPADGLEDYQNASPDERLAILKYESEIFLDIIQYYAQEINAFNTNSIDNLPDLFLFWGKDLLRSINILKDMVKTLT